MPAAGLLGAPNQATLFNTHEELLVSLGPASWDPPRLYLACRDEAGPKCALIVAPMGGNVTHCEAVDRCRWQYLNREFSHQSAADVSNHGWQQRHRTRQRWP